MLRYETPPFAHHAGFTKPGIRKYRGATFQQRPSYKILLVRFEIGDQLPIVDVKPCADVFESTRINILFIIQVHARPLAQAISDACSGHSVSARTLPALSFSAWS